MILALESSCDETAVAGFDPSRGLVGEWVHSQIAVHEKHGGVVPDLATREHLRQFGPLLEKAREELVFTDISAVAVTQGPGLAACLAIGLASAKALAMAIKVPLIGVNHLRGHAFSPFIALHEQSPGDFSERFEKMLPHLGLIVSGGNTVLFSLDRDRRIKVLSTTRDDAAGEALDKGAKLLGLGYPGGPWVEKLALKGNPHAYDFPRGLGRRDDLDFSFSGLKTSLRYQLEKMSVDEICQKKADLCASYQQAVIDALVRKTEAALSMENYVSVGVSGGVANNRLLRDTLQARANRARKFFLAALPKHTGDNAGMIAFAAWADLHGADRTLGFGLQVEPGLELQGPVYL